MLIYLRDNSHLTKDIISLCGIEQEHHSEEMKAQ